MAFEAVPLPFHIFSTYLIIIIGFILGGVLPPESQATNILSDGHR
jgi:hypothetical protein